MKINVSYSSVKLFFRMPLYSIAVLLLLAGCEDSDKYYETLDNQPELVTIPGYNRVYAIGDTIKINGRLNPENNLTIRIGDAEGLILSSVHNEFLNTDEVKIIITNEMGIGPNRPVQITSNAITISGPAIEIVGSSSEGVLPEQLELEAFYTIPAGSYPINSRTGSGSVYFWNTNKTLTKVLNDGTSATVFAQGMCTDANGNFTIQEFYSGAVDPSEHYFYFSARVREVPNNTQNQIFKLCRLDLQTQEFTVLNRTLYPIAPAQRTQESIMPFEGNISAVKMFVATGIYPDAQGNIYFNLMANFITKLDSSGNYSYIFDLNINQNLFLPFIPLINDPATNQLSSIEKMHEVLPGVIITTNGVLNIDADEKVLYAGYTTGNNLTQYDLATQTEVYRMRGGWSYHAGRPYLTASFDMLSGPSYNNTIPGAFGFMPMPGNNLMLLMYQDIAESPTVDESYQLPAFCQLNFETKNGKRYAPNKLQRNGFVMGVNDKMINYDADGMIYMTANNNTVLVKTKFLN